MFQDGDDLRSLTLLERKKRLKATQLVDPWIIVAHLRMLKGVASHTNLLKSGG
jgi:hypothetical protein